MRVARWRLALAVPMVVLLAACLPSTTQGLPASFVDDVRQGGWTFVAASPGPDAVSATTVVADLRQRTLYGDFLASRAIPVFGVLSCGAGPGGCVAPRPPWGDEPGTVWLILYPDSAIPGGDIGWALVDGVDGWSLDRYMVHRPGDRP